MKNGVPRVLIIRLSSIGDVIRVLPALHALRRTYPHAQIDWLVERKSADIVVEHPELDEALVFERTDDWRAALKTFRRLCKSIRTRRYDIVVDFHGIFKSGLLTAFSGAPERYGFARPRSQEGSSLALNHRTKLPSSDLNRVEENLILCEALGPRPSELDVGIHVAPEVQDEVNEFFEHTFQSGKKVVAMHAPVERKEKQWPLEYFASLTDMLIADGRFEVMLTWGPGQLDLVERIVRKTRRNPRVAPETPDLKHYAWLVHRSDLYFGGDTGPMHIAWVMGTPVVAVFGGTDPRKHAPFREPYEVLAVGSETDPATLARLSPTERLRRITPDMAYDACIRVAHP